MSLIQQILWGSIFLGVCLISQVICLAACVRWLTTVVDRVRDMRAFTQLVVIMSLALSVIVFAHTLQVWIWALILIGGDLMGDWNDALYFSMVTYRSLGYGDIVLGPEARLFLAFAAVTGLLSFGISTAFLVGVMPRLITNEGDLLKALQKRRK